MADTFGICSACNKKFRNKIELAGKKIKCPCGKGSIAFPAIDAPAAEAPAARPQSRSDDLDFAEPAPPKPVAERPAASACPGCKKPLPAGAVFCTNCGYNTKTGKTLKTEIE